MKIYISGSISGRPEEEVVARFSEAKQVIEQCGHTAVSPLYNGLPYDASWREHMKADINMLFDCDAILMLFEWKRSKGARIEHNIATELGLTVFYSFAGVRHINSRNVPTNNYHSHDKADKADCND